MNRIRLRAFLVLLLTFSVCEGQAAPINPQSILVSHINGNGRAEILEFSRTGAVLQNFLVPSGTGSSSNLDIRAIEMDQNGKVQIFNGTFAPYLTTLTPQSAPGAATFEHHTIAGWSVVGNTSYGGIAIDAARNAIYANDMTTAGSGGPNGIIRFDSNTFAATRKLSGIQNGRGDYTKVTLGQNGLLYASYPPLHPGNNVLDVIDPTNFSILRAVTLPTNGLITFTGFAVDAQGYIYGTEGEDWGTGISKFSPQGAEIAHLSVNISYPWLHDLALSPDGMLVTVSHDGDVVMTTTDLVSYTSFRSSLIDSDQTFVAWAGAVPEPSALWLLLCGICAIALMRSAPRFRAFCSRH